MIIYLHILQWN